MSEEEIKQLLNKNIELSERIYQSLEKQRKIRRWTLIIGLVVIVLPLIIAIISIPWILSTMESYYGGLLNL